MSLVFTPLAIPPIPNKQKIIDNFVGAEKYVWWKEETLLGEKDFSKPLGQPYDWNAHAKEKYPELIEWVNNYFPFEHLFYVRLARSTGNVSAHVDGNKVEAPHSHHMTITQEMLDHQMDNEPIGYRFVVSGSRDSLYMCNEYDYSKDMSKQPKHFCTIPEDTDGFLINNCTQPHGVDVQDGVDDDRIVGFLLGKVNISAHEQLIEASTNKYATYKVHKNELRI
tara:strand:- start:8333 stop:9001 length:669 start_codon:yes stop_codon:yes gene_type:complete